MATEKLYFKKLRGSIHLDDGTWVTLEEGDEVPANADKDELARWQRDDIDAVGTKAELQAEQNAREAALNTAGDGVPADGTDPTPPRQRPTPAGPDLELLGGYDDTELAGLWTSNPPNVKDVLATVGDNATLAQKALDAENTATKGDPRTTLKDGLEKVISGSAGGS